MNFYYIFNNINYIDFILNLNLYLNYSLLNFYLYLKFNLNLTSYLIFI